MKKPLFLNIFGVINGTKHIFFLRPSGLSLALDCGVEGSQPDPIPWHL